MSVEENQLPSSTQPRITREFPFSGPKGFDAAVFGELLRNAMRAYLQIISRSEPRTFAREVFRLRDHGFFAVDVGIWPSTRARWSEPSE